MTILDDQVFGTLFGEAGTAFEIPEDGMAEILRRAGGDNSIPITAEGASDDDAGVDSIDATPKRRSFGGSVRTHRLLAVAASVMVLVVAIAAGGVLFGHSTKRNVSNSSVALAPALAPNHAPNHGPVVQGSATGGAATGSPTNNSAASQFGVDAPNKSSKALSEAPTSTSTATPNGKAAYIEQTGSLTLQVRDHGVAATIVALRSLAAANGGYVANSTTQANAGVAGVAPNGNITLQIPEANFGAALKQAEALGKNVALSTKATNVTGNYVDLQAKIAALQSSLTQYELIMTKAQSIGDILAVQAQVVSLQTQIQQLQGQLQSLNNQTSYSTLTVQVQQKGIVIQPPAHRSGLSRAWHNSVHGFTDGIEGVIGVAGPVLFVLICLGVVLLVGRVLWRRWQRHNL